MPTGDWVRAVAPTPGWALGSGKLVESQGVTSLLCPSRLHFLGPVGYRAGLMYSHCLEWVRTEGQQQPQTERGGVLTFL